MLNVLKGIQSYIQRTNTEQPPKERKELKIKCWKCGEEGHLRNLCPRLKRSIRFQQKNDDHVLQILSMHEGDRGLYVEGEVNGVACRMIIDTGASVTIVRTDMTRRMGGQFLYTAPSVSLRPVMSDHIGVHGKLEVIIAFGFATYKQLVYVADISDPCILGLDFLRKCNFSLDLKNNSLHTTSEDVETFKIENEELPVRRILASQDFTIPAGTECFVIGKHRIKLFVARY